MTLSLNPHPSFKGRKGPLLLIVMDGIGLAHDHPGNAVSRAKTPVLDKLMQSKLGTQLTTHGTAVGLPDDDDMGNSEVGHNALGAGRVIEQGASLVNKAIKTGALFSGSVWKKVILSGQTGGTVHLLGLLSDGNVHANIDHLLTLLSALNTDGIIRVRIHTLLDGRDVAPQSALLYLDQLQAHLDGINASGKDYHIASGGGRQVITMDRYNANIQMVKLGYDCHVHGNGKKVDSAHNAVKQYYAKHPDGIDQDIPAFVVIDENGKPLGAMKDDDAVVLYNFRGDRAIEISSAFEQDKFETFDRGVRPSLYFCSMIEYDGDLHIPQNFLVSPPKIKNTMVEYLCALGLKTFAISETQKFGHVTYFWNGNRSGYLCKELETYTEIKSDIVPFNLKPQMKAREICDAALAQLGQPGIRFGRINFANGDMVGHTGDFEATRIAVQTVDQCIGELIEATTKLDGVVIVTADHGNAEEMTDPRAQGKVVKTSHTLNPVPFVIVDANYAWEYRLREDIERPSLVNVASTVINLLGYEAPEDFAGSLIEFDKEYMVSRK